MEKLNVVRFADGTTGEVPESERETFEREAAAEGAAWEPVGLVRFADGTTGEVPESQRETFEREAAEEGAAWEPVRAVRAGGATLEIPESQRQEFIRDYNADPSLRGEREETARKVAARLDKGLSFEERLGPVAAAALNYGKELVNPFNRDATPVRTRLEAAANVGRGAAAAPFTLAEKAADAVGFAARGVEALAGAEEKSGFREALERSKQAMAEWRERNLGEIGDTEEWSVTFGGRAANSITEAFMTAGLARAAQAARGIKAGADAAATGGRLASVWQAMKNPSAQSALYGLSQAEQTAAKGEKAGAAKWKQMLAGGVSGTAETALESVSQVFGLQGQARDALRGPVEREVRRRLANVLGEGATEGLQQLKTGAVERLAAFDDADWGEIGAASAQAVALGMISAGAGELGNLAALEGAGRGLRETARERAAGDAALRASDGTAAEVEAERSAREAANGNGQAANGNGQAATGNGQEATGNGQGATGNGQEAEWGTGYGQGAQNGEPQAGGDGQDGGVRAAQEDAAQAGGEGGGSVAAAQTAALTLAGGARIGALETRPGKGGAQIKGVRLLMPDGSFLWRADPGETALAEYWLKDRVEFPPAPAGYAGWQTGEPRVNASRRAGFDLKPGKSVLVELGRSKKPYPAVVVEVLDDTHVRVRVAKVQRALKNNRSGYADIDVRQTREYNSAAVKRRNEEDMRRAGLGPKERARVRKDAAEFDRLLLEGDEIADQRSLEYAASLTGRESGKARSEETAKARLRAAAMLETDEDVTTPLGRARALPLLRKLLADMRAGTDAEGRLETPEELWLERFRQEAEAESAELEREPLILEDMTLDEQDAELERVRSARERAAQREEMARRAAAPLTGTAGDMTGTLPGMEGVSDVPLFTERGGNRQPAMGNGQETPPAEGAGESVNPDNWIRFAEEAAAKSWQHYEGSIKRRDAGKRAKNTSDHRREWETIMRIADKYGIDRKEAEAFLTPHIMSALNGKKEFFESIRSAARQRIEQGGELFNMAPGAGKTLTVYRGERTSNPAEQRTGYVWTTENEGYAKTLGAQKGMRVRKFEVRGDNIADLTDEAFTGLVVDFANAYQHPDLGPDGILAAFERGDLFRALDWRGQDALLEMVRKAGYDGVRYRENADGGVNVVLFDPGMIETVHYNMAPGGRTRTVAPGPGSVYGQESGGAGAQAQTARTEAPASGLPVEEGPQERRGVGMDMRDAVQMYRELTGMLPRIKERMRKQGVLGLFRNGTKEIELLAGIFGLVDAQDEAAIRRKQSGKGLAGPELEQAVSRELAALTETRRREPQKRPLKVLVHELAHLVDYLPDEMVRGRGNILGHIAALKRHMAGAIAPAPGQPGPLTDAEKRALRGEAEREMRAALGAARTIIEEITREVPEFRTVGITAEDVKALLGESGGRSTPELYQWFAAQDSIVKREIMIRALKGVVDERAARAAGARLEATGRTVTETARVSRDVPGYTAADGRRRFRELLREETARRRLIEREAVVSEAESIIPWWRGVEEMEDYFRQPKEMYAELFGIFLADPKALEERAPETFRAFAGWMNARATVKRAYDAYLQSRDDGTAGLKHAERLEETMRREYEADWQETQDRLNRPTWGEKWDQFRMHFDRRRAPYQAALARINRMQLAEAKDPAERKRLHEEHMRGLALAKRESRGGNVLKIFLQKMTGNVESRLAGAGLDMVSLSKYLTLRRIAFELDGRAAPLGFDPASSIKELDEWRGRLGEKTWGELEKAAVEWRVLIEELLHKNPEVREMLGAETMAMIEKNKDYVTFSHVPIKEQAAAFKADMDRADGDLRLLSEDSLAFMARWIERRAGTAASPQIFELKGSFDPVKNVLVATIQKYDSILRAARRNAMKRQLHELAEKSGYGGVLKAKWEYDKKTGKQMPVMVDNRRWKTVVYMDGGELNAFTANRPLAESLESDKASESELFNAAVRMNNLFKSLYTSLNYSFMFFNNMRDLQRAAGNVQGLWRSPVVFAPGGQFVASLARNAPEAFVRSLPSWIVNDGQLEWYLSAAHEAGKLAVKGNWSEAAREADRLQAEGNPRQAEYKRRVIALAQLGMEKGFVMSHIEAVRAAAGVSDFERVLHRAGVRKIEAERAKGLAAGLAGWFRGKAERAAEFVQEKGEIGEHTTKLAVLAFLMDKRADMGMDEKLMVVTEWGGSPDFNEYGTWSRYLEAATSPFFNASKEGVLGTVRAFKDHPGEWALKKSVYVVAPAMMRWALYSGAGMAAVAALYPDPEDRERLPFWNFLQWCYRNGKNISDYYGKNYITHPLPINTGNPDVSVILTLPMDQGDQVLSTLTQNLMEFATGWDAGKADAPLAQSLEALGSGFVPDGVGNAPLLAILGLVKGYFMGSNYRDPFTNKEVWTQPELDTRWSRADAAKVLFGELSNRMGGGMVKRFRRDNPFGEDMPPLNEFLNLPFVQPSLGRTVRLAHSGDAQAAARLEGIEDKIKAPMVLQARADFLRAVREGGGNGHLNFSQDISDRMSQPGGAWYSDEIQRLMVRYQNEREHNPLLDAWSRSKDQTVRKRFENHYRLKVLSEE
jgi:hypothetical protein